MSTATLSATDRTTRIPVGWMRGVFAGLETALAGWLVVTVMAMATYATTASAPALGEASWATAMGAGTSIWHLAHGGILAIPDATFTLIPLGLTLLLMWFVSLSVRRHSLSMPAAAFAIPIYALLVWSFAPVAAGPTGWPGLVLGSIAVPAVGIAHAWWISRRRARADGELGAAEVLSLSVVRAAGTNAESHYPRTIDTIARALRLIPLVLAMVVAAGVAVVVTAMISNYENIAALHSQYSFGVVGFIIAVLAQLVFLPNAVMWGLSWLAGPGFHIGDNTLIATEGAHVGLIPAIPLLGAVPTDGGPQAGWTWAVFLLIGFIAAVVLRRPADPGRVVDTVIAALGTSAGVGLILLCIPASGAIGPGLMDNVGSPSPMGPVIIASYLALGAAGLALVIHPGLHSGIGSAVRAGRTTFQARRAAARAEAGSEANAPLPADGSAPSPEREADQAVEADAASSPPPPPTDSDLEAHRFTREEPGPTLIATDEIPTITAVTEESAAEVRQAAPASLTWNVTGTMSSPGRTLF